MELNTLTPDLPKLLVEMGVQYDPQRLASIFASQPVDLAARAAVVATKLGGFITMVSSCACLSGRHTLDYSIIGNFCLDTIASYVFQKTRLSCSACAAAQRADLLFVVFTMLHLLSY